MFDELHDSVEDVLDVRRALVPDEPSAARDLPADTEVGAEAACDVEGVGACALRGAADVEALCAAEDFEVEALDIAGGYGSPA